MATVKEEPPDEEVMSDLPLNCLLCTKIFNSITGLKAHVIAQHSYKTVKRKAVNSSSPDKRKASYVCKTCRRSFVTSTDLMVHETCHNKAICYSCDKQFDNFKQLSKHRLKSCKDNKNNVKAHKLITLDDVRRTPTGDLEMNSIEDMSASGLYKCDMCQESFTDDYYLKIHEEVQHSTAMDSLEDTNPDNELLVEITK